MPDGWDPVRLLVLIFTWLSLIPAYLVLGPPPWRDPPARRKGFLAGL